MASSLKLASIPVDVEQRRLAALRHYDILDTPPDGAFDKITQLAARLFSVPIAIVSLVDEDRIWFKSHHGLPVREVARAPGLCASAILQDEAYIINDAAKDPRSLANPLVAGELGLRFYLGVPLKTHDQYNLGTLCIIDREPRIVTKAEVETLSDLADLVVDQMEVRLAARNALAAKDEALKQAELLSVEIEHRIKNSLSIVSSLLRMQAKSSTPETAEQLAMASSRINAVARVHQHISLNSGIEAAECGAYIRAICEELMHPLGLDSRNILVESVELEMAAKRLIPLGLIVNELVTNAVKHGSGDIRVGLSELSSGRLMLEVVDDGQGLAKDLNPAAVPGLGMKIVRMLAQQLGGDLRVDSLSAQSAHFKVEFPLNEDKETL